MEELDWIRRSDWSQRGPEFGGLRVVQAGGGAVVAMEFAPSAGTEGPVTLDRRTMRLRTLCSAGHASM